MDFQAGGSELDQQGRFLSGRSARWVTAMVRAQPQDEEKHDASGELEIELHVRVPS